MGVREKIKENIGAFVSTRSQRCVNGLGLLTKGQLCRIFANRVAETGTGYRSVITQAIQRLRQDYPILHACAFYDIGSQTPHWSEHQGPDKFPRAMAEIQDRTLTNAERYSYYVALGRLRPEYLVALSSQTVNDIRAVLPEMETLPASTIARVVLYHETAHFLDDKNQRLDEKYMSESFADTFAFLRLMHETGDHAATAEIAGLFSTMRAKGALIGDDADHLSTLAIDTLLSQGFCNAQDMPPEALIDLAYGHLAGALPDPAYVARLNTSIRYMQIDWSNPENHSVQTLEQFIFSRMTGYADRAGTDRGDPYFVYIAAKALKPEIDRRNTGICPDAFDKAVATLASDPYFSRLDLSSLRVSASPAPQRRAEISP